MTLLRLQSMTLLCLFVWSQIVFAGPGQRATGVVGVVPRVGFYSQVFDPPTLEDMDILDQAKESYNLSKIFVFPALKSDAESKAQPFATRWKLLKAAVKDRPEFVLPPLRVLEPFLDDQNPNEQLVQDAVVNWYRSIDSTKAEIFQIAKADESLTFSQMNDIIKDRDLILVGKRKPKNFRSRRLHFVSNTSMLIADVNAYRNSPLEWEGILPKSVAQMVKQKGLYGRGPERGIYDLLPSHIARLYNEQLLNNRNLDTNVFINIKMNNELSPQFLPEGRPSFRIYTVDVPISDLMVLGSLDQLPAQANIFKEGRQFIRFFVHPDSKSFFAKAFENYKWDFKYLASPLSSHRSLIAWNPNGNEPAMYIKVSLNVKIGDVNRNLRWKQLQRAYAISSLVKTLDVKELAKRGIHFVDEPVSLMVKGLGVGLTYRSDAAAEAPDLDIEPMFSYFTKRPGAPPKIVTMIRQSGLPAREFIRKWLIDPLVNQAVFLAETEGMVGEPHQQNVLWATKGGQPTRDFWYTDFGGFAISPEERAKAGKNMSFLPADVDETALKAERVDLPAKLETYLRDGNLHAVQQALVEYYPEITQKWIDSSYQDSFDRRTKLSVTNRCMVLF